MARSKTRQHSAPDMPVRFFQLPDGQPVAVLSVAVFRELFVLACAAAKAQEASPVMEQREPSLGKVIAGPTIAELKAQATIKKYLLDDGARAAVLREASAMVDRGEFGPMSEPIGLADPEESAEEAADLATYEEARAREEEAFPLEVAERLVAGVHPIKVFREYRGITQAELARQVGLSPMYISQIETGRRGGSTKALRRIAAALEIDLADLVR